VFAFVQRLQCGRGATAALTGCFADVRRRIAVVTYVRARQLAPLRREPDAPRRSRYSANR